MCSKNELSNYLFRVEAENILEKCREISNSIEIKEEEKENTSDNKDTKNHKEEKEKQYKEALSNFRDRISTLIDYVEDDILLFKEDSFNDMSEEEFKENFCYVEQSLKELTEALILSKKEDKYYDSYFDQFCQCLYDRCKLEYARCCNFQGHTYRISDLLLMVSDKIRQKITN